MYLGSPKGTCYLKPIRYHSVYLENICSNLP